MSCSCHMFLLLWLVMPRALAAQAAAVPQLGLDADTWHAALEARAALKDSVPLQTDVLRALSAELTLGRPERIGLVLDRYPVTDPNLERQLLAVEAEGALASRSYTRAGELFGEAAAAASGQARGVLAARSGDAFERAGKFVDAARQYHSARESLWVIADWLALREARVTPDSTVAFALLERAPAAARRMIPCVKGEFFVLVGDTARAVAVLAGAGFDGRAAVLALGAGDTSNARQLAYRAVRSSDTSVANIGIELARTRLEPRTSDDYVELSRAIRRKEPAQAALWMGEAVARGDTSVRTLFLWGDILVEAGKLAASLDAYTQAAHGQDEDAIQAEFARARVLIRLSQRRAAAVALEKFLRRHPTHAMAPTASFLLADLEQDAGRLREADSLFHLVIERWPANEYASQARMRLATRSLSDADTSGAGEFYRSEVAVHGAQQFAARYLLGSLERRGRDTALAGETLLALAREDSLGYYGFLARSKLGLAAPTVAPTEAHPLSADLATAIEQLDLLDQAGFATEASAFIAWLMVEVGNGEALELASALSSRGRTSQSITLGWRAARTRTLNDAGVLRAIYPWPYRTAVAAEAAEFGLDPYLVAALVRQESNFTVDALSKAGARGLMQVMPGTARDAARRMGLDWSDRLLLVADANLHVGAAHFANLLRRFQGDAVSALAAYNAGLLPVERWRRFPGSRDPALFVERIPYAETRGYVRSVLRNWTIYRSLYPQVPILDRRVN